MKTTRKLQSGLLLPAGLVLLAALFLACDNPFEKGEDDTKKNTDDMYTVTFDTGDGTGTAPSSQTRAAGDIIYLPGKGNMLSPEGKNFTGWLTGGQNYTAGDTFTVTAAVVFIAQWKEIDPETGPIIVNTGIENGKFAVERYKTTSVSGGAVFVSAQQDSKGKYVTAYLGRIDWVPVIWSNPKAFLMEGMHYTYTKNEMSSFSETDSSTKMTSETVSDTATNEAGAAFSAGYTFSSTVGTSAGADVGFAKAEVSAEVKQEIALSMSVHMNTSLSHTNVSENTLSKSFETSRTRMIENSESFDYTLSEDKGDIPQYIYRYTSFATTEVFANLVFDSAGNLKETHYTGIIIPGSYREGMDYAPTWDGFVKIGNTPDLTLTLQDIERLSTYEAGTVLPGTGGTGIGTPPPVAPMGTNPGIDVWGGKLTYTYKALSSGTITVELVGGGAGGSGAAAARDGGWLGGTNRAYAGTSAAGSPTILRLNETEMARANGGAGVQGADTGDVDGAGPWIDKEVYKNGNTGNNGQVKGAQITVSTGDIITIEVGWGGGGSGGAAINDTGGTISSDNADNKTLGSAGNSSNKPGQTAANASRGGMGGMHSLVFPTSEYTSDSQKGGSSPNAGNAAAAAGGQTKGAGGAAGDEYATGGMYASGGGGGAAGGFTLKSATVAVMEL
jgi:hypothetical protein